MDEIGGYFELELRKGEHYHKNAIRLNTARNAFEYILRVRKYNKVYIPYYTCEVMVQPLLKLGIKSEFYQINEKLEPINLPQLKYSEAFLYTNYYGLKQSCVERLAEIYKHQLIVDNAQAFYTPAIKGIDTFYSARKFFGVPDGAYLYTDRLLDEEIEQDKSFYRMKHLIQRIDEGAESAYSLFKKNDNALDNQPIKQMSRLTERILQGIDFDFIKYRRRENYNFLSKNLFSRNILQLELPNDAVPMVYPYVTEDLKLKKRLISNKVFVATYWPNVFKWADKKMLDYKLAEQLIAIPIDQRYSLANLECILNLF